MTRKKKLVLFVCLMTTIFFTLLTTIFRLYKDPSLKTIDKLTSQVLSECSHQIPRQTCYNNTISNLMDKPKSISIQQAFQVLDKVQSSDSTYNYCHSLGHYVGRKEVAKDPSRWREVISNCPQGKCASGCIHGALMERFGKEYLSNKEINELKPELVKICQKQSTAYDQAGCYHALGHTAMLVTGINIPKSISLCNELTPKQGEYSFLSVCLDGIFMQIFQPLEPEELALVRRTTPSKYNVDKFCSEQETSDAIQACYRESWPLFLVELKTNEGVDNFCKKFSDEKQKISCYSAVFYIMAVQLNLDEIKLSEYCSSFSKQLVGICFAKSAQRIIHSTNQLGQAINLCSKPRAIQDQNYCYQDLVNRARFNFSTSSSKYEEFCNLLPNRWKNRCNEN